MQLFIDSADIEEVRRAASLGVISGVTTNPKLAAAAEPGSFRSRVGEILAACPGQPLSVEVLGETFEDMLSEASDYASWSDDIVVKIPMSLEALRVIHTLERERDVRVNVTCMMSSGQTALALLAGASYVSLFVGRINDLGHDADTVIAETAEFIERGGFDARIIAGSMRQTADVRRSFLAGAHIVTVSYHLLSQMAHHPRTVETIREFKDAWDNARDIGDLST